MLSGTRYEQLGGVQGALTRQADTALADAIAAGGRSRDQVIAGLLRLVTVDKQGRWSNLLAATSYEGTLTGHTDSVASVAFSPDGHTLATASRDGAAILWDLTNPTQPRRLGQPLTDHTNAMTSVAFSPDDRTLATGSTDRTVRLWDLTGLNYLLGHAVERVCAVTGGGLDRGDWARYIPGLPYQETCPV